MSELFFLVCFKFGEVFDSAIAFVGIVSFWKIIFRKSIEKLFAKLPFSDIA
jgi:hypothetical protein